MKRLLTLILGLIVLISCSQADEFRHEKDTEKNNTTTGRLHKVGVKKAEKRLRGFMAQNGGRYASPDGEVIDTVFPLVIPVPTDSVTLDDGNEADDTLFDDNTVDDYVRELEYAYVFNFADNGGFAIMGALEELPEIIAFSEEGRIDPSDTEINETSTQNPGFKVFLRCLMEYTEITISTSMEGDGSDDKDYGIYTYGEWQKNYINGRKGLCPVKWMQRDPYNMYCPTKNGEPTLVGCVAVATGQLMACHRYPTAYQANGNNYTFNWSEMTQLPTTLDGETRQKQQVARLLRELGTKDNLNNKYGIDGTSAYLKDVVRTLRNFSYQNPGKYEDFDENEIYSELRNGYPVLVSGATKKGATGHCWLIHGLMTTTRPVYYTDNHGNRKSFEETQEFLQCNWGWLGLNDGFFLARVFNTANAFEFEGWYDDSEIHEYNVDLKMVTGIRH